MNAAELEKILSGLKGFQRDAVEHIVHRFYRAPGSSGRFLVADETGLGKSVVARGVIASAISELQTADHVERIDVIYICSSVDLAKQNLRRLNVTDDPHIGITSRLTLLALDSQSLSAPGSGSGKKVNLVSFTPGTSFEMGWHTGSQAERQLLHILLNGMQITDEPTERASAVLFQGTVRSLERFRERIKNTRIFSLKAGPDPVIQREFRALIEANGLMERFLRMRDKLMELDEVPQALWSDVNRIISEMRSALAKASVESLDPDLVILDEFQRFKHLIDSDSGSEASELAHNLFEFPHAKVLLLSATPYKPFTTVAGDAEEDHYEDFMTTLKFWANSDAAALTRIRNGFSRYRTSLLSGADAEHEAAELREALVPYMSRSERPPLAEGRDLLVRRVVSEVPTPTDLRAYAALQAFAREIDSPVSLEYWKSIPYFGSFMECYRPGERARTQIQNGTASPALRARIARLRGVDSDAISSYEGVDYANARLRAFAAETVDQEWWKLLWMPPSMPYVNPGAVYSAFADGSVTKRLIFSAWSSVPTSVASLLSYEAERKMVKGSIIEDDNSAEARKSVSGRLDYVLRDEKPASMSTLALFWPHPQLAALGDPLRLPREAGELPDADAALKHVDSLIWATSESVDTEVHETASDAFFAWPGSWPKGEHRKPDVAAFFISGRGGSGNDREQADAGRGIPPHAKAAFAKSTSANWHPELAALALNSPGNIAYRALARIVDDLDDESPLALRSELWHSAARLANGIRSLFNRIDVMFLLDQLYPKQPYWRSVLEYCSDGNLQAVLDEYCFHLKLELAGAGITAASLRQIANRAIEAITLHTSRYVARATDAELTRIPITVRFALRYGGAGAGVDSESARQPEVRNAFNSPFWPFVLASISVRQEGMDFHWWSHSVVHWNLPSNPVDFEQREGRVNRFGGHAVRKNVAAAHGELAILASTARAMGSGLADDTGLMRLIARSPWACAFESAADNHPDLGEFSPWWIYPGKARVERMVVHFPFSREEDQYKRLTESLALYRLTLGQPRQEDMLELLGSRGVKGDDAAGGAAKLDLRPPARA